MPPRQITLGTTDLPVNRGQEPQVALSLRRAGCEVEVIGDEPDRILPGRWLLLWYKANSYPRIYRRLLAMRPEERPPLLIWHCENLPPPGASGLPWPWLSFKEIAKILLRDSRANDPYTNYFLLRRLARAGLPQILVVSARNRQQFLTDRSIPAEWSPIGYSDDMGRDLGLERDIDVVFLGSLDVPRRNRLLAELERKGIRLVKGGSWSDPAFWGENRTRLLNRAKIFLNFARIPGELSGERLLLGMANKTLVISEPIYDPFPYVPDTHFVMTPMEKMVECIQHYLGDEEKRRRIVEIAHAFAVGERHIDRSTGRVLEMMANWEKNAE